MSQQVQFRRINGRIVPIRTKLAEGAKGAGLATAGAGVAAGAGAVAAKLHRDAAMNDNLARTLKGVSMFEIKNGQVGAGHRTRKMAAKAIIEERRFRASGVSTRRLGLAAGSALIGAGVHKALGQTALKDDEKTKAAISTGASLASVFAIRSGYGRIMTVSKTRTFDVLKHALKRTIVKRGL